MVAVRCMTRQQRMKRRLRRLQILLQPSKGLSELRYSSKSLGGSNGANSGTTSAVPALPTGLRIRSPRKFPESSNTMYSFEYLVSYCYANWHRWRTEALSTFVLCQREVRRPHTKKHHDTLQNLQGFIAGMTQVC